MRGQEDDGVIDEEERHHIDEAWRKAKRTRLVREARSGNVGRRMISFWNIGQMLVEQIGALRESSGGHSSSAAFFCDQEPQVSEARREVEI